MAIFTDVFEDVTKQGRKIPTSDYHESGAYPIIDQGQTVIAGYTDETEGLFTDVPAIIFGDHTRVVKYVDTPCFLGADGVKLLKPKVPNANHKYLYHVLANAKIPNTGYNRHFKWLKEVNIPLPTEVEQQRIVEVLDRLDELIALRKEQLAKLDELVKARFVEMFGDPETNPKKWPVTTIGNVMKSCEAGWSGNGTMRPRNPGEIAVLKVSAVTKGFFIPDECKVLDDQKSIKKYVFPEKGDLIFSRANTKEMVGATAVIPQDYPDLILPDKLWKIRFVDTVNVMYMKHLLSNQSIRTKFSDASTGTSGSMYNVSMDKFKAIMIPLPIESLQQEFAAFVEQTNKSKLTIQASLDKLEVMKKALMQEYFD